MRKLENGWLPWDANECNIEEFKRHLLSYREGYESKSMRAVVIAEDVARSIVENCTAYVEGDYGTLSC
jgi:hypothetical protein